MIEFIGIVIGGFITFFIQWIFRKMDKRDKEIHFSSLLENDLKSIEYYLEKERGSVNMRYFEKWQDTLAECSFLDNKSIEYVYNIYDLVYNYNYKYEQLEKRGKSIKKEDIKEYKSLQRKIFWGKDNSINFKEYNDKYKQVIEKLHRYK